MNGETRHDRRISQINCSTTADVRSGYVFRLDVDFDPVVDPATLFDRTFVDPERGLVNLRREHEGASGEPYTAPLMSFQRPTGRFDEHHFFAAAASQVALFRSRDLPRMPTDTPEQQRERAEVDAETAARLALIRTLHHGYFDLPESTDDRRAPHTGIMTRDILTKAAHFEMLRRTLPPGWWTLVTEQEGMLPRILPHVFRAEIEADDFAWLAVIFDKEVTKPKVQDAWRRSVGPATASSKGCDGLALPVRTVWGSGVVGRVMGEGFGLAGWETAEGGVASRRVVEAFHVAEGGHLRLGLGAEAAAGQKLALQRGEEALAHRVVGGVADRARRWLEPGLAAPRPEPPRLSRRRSRLDSTRPWRRRRTSRGTGPRLRRAGRGRSARGACGG